MPRIFKNKWFWVSVVLLFVFAIIWDIFLASFILVTSLGSGKWSSTLLVLGLLYTVTVVYPRYLPKEDRKQYGWVRRLLLLVIAFIAFANHGFFQGLYFLATVFIFSRFMKWIAWIFVRRKPAIV